MRGIRKCRAYGCSQLLASTPLRFHSITRTAMPVLSMQPSRRNCVGSNRKPRQSRAVWSTELSWSETRKNAPITPRGWEMSLGGLEVALKQRKGGLRVPTTLANGHSFPVFYCTILNPKLYKARGHVNQHLVGAPTIGLFNANFLYMSNPLPSCWFSPSPDVTDSHPSKPFSFSQRALKHAGANLLGQYRKLQQLAKVTLLLSPPLITGELLSWKRRSEASDHALASTTSRSERQQRTYLRRWPFLLPSGTRWGGPRKLSSVWCRNC